MSPLPADQASIRFMGPHWQRGRRQQVLWNLTLYTLQHYRKVHANDTNAFIEIGNTETEPYDITVALPVRQIDLPVIRKTLIMIRGYKRLRPGRHEFGATH